MAADRALLDHAIVHQVPDPLVRVFVWSSPALSVGRHQRVDEQLLRGCTNSGIELVRRPTGGTAVVHGGDVTYSVVAPCNSMSVLQTYRWVARGLVAALERLNLAAYVSEHPPTPRSASCFASSSGADLSVGGAKICGSAQVRRRGWFLQHGSIPITDQRSHTSRLLNTTGPDTSTCLDQLRPGTTSDQLTEALLQGFAQVWGKCLEFDFREHKILLAETSMLA